MRTTVTIDDKLLEVAKRTAESRHLTLGQYVEEALQRHVLAAPPAAPGPELPVFTGGGDVRPGIDPRSNASLYDAMDDVADEPSARREPSG